MSQTKQRYKKFLLQVARKWISVVSNECSALPDSSSGNYKRAPYKESTFQAFRKTKRPRFRINNHCRKSKSN